MTIKVEWTIVQSSLAVKILRLEGCFFSFCFTWSVLMPVLVVKLGEQFILAAHIDVDL